MMSESLHNCMTMESFTHTVNSDYAQVGEAARLILAHTQPLVSDDMTRIHLELAIVEAANNCIEHAYKDETHHEIFFEVFIDDEQLVVDITDHGSPMPRGRLEQALSYDELEEAGQEIDSTSGSGRGLTLLKSILDDVSYTSHDGANTLSLRLDIVRD